VKIVPRLGRNLTIVVHSARWRSKRDWFIAIWCKQINRQLLVHSAKVLIGLYILLLLIPFFLYSFLMIHGDRLSQDPLDQFLQSLHHMVGIELQMINPTFYFRYLKGRSHGNQFCGKIVPKIPTPLRLSLCYSETEWDIATAMYALTA